ncbi:MAG: YmfQ family protein [Clostridium sp.]|nr:YmfQ family protein [Clostridium sp.]
MTKEVDLVSYLPSFLAEFKEIAVALEAENPEFTLVWNAADRVLYNEFIATADEYGISRFEKILNILPSREDTLESRRTNVMSKWLSDLPYTMKILIKNLQILCGGNDFTISKSFNNYTIRIITH